LRRGKIKLKQTGIPSANGGTGEAAKAGSHFSNNRITSEGQRKDLSPVDRLPAHSVGYELGERLDWFRLELERCSDAIFHPFVAQGSLHCVLIYMKGMTDVDMFQETVLKGILSSGNTECATDLIRRMVEFQQVAVMSFKQETEVDKSLEAVLDGHILLMFDGEPNMLLFPFSKMEKRSVSEPFSENVVRGPRDSFIEDIQTNLTLLRRRIKSSSLKTEELHYGLHTKTTVYLVYMEGICEPRLINEVKSRLSRIDLDGVLGSSYIEEYIEDNPYSPFPQMQYTERPDTLAGSLLEGRIAIMVDGTPIQIMAPVTLIMFLHSAEDYYQRFYQSTWIRWLRYMFMAVSLLMPSFYIAISTFHPEMLPRNLLLAVSAAREITPFPALVEALFLELMFEVLREGALRAPKPVGQSISIVGGLVIGQAAVQAGIVSAPMVIIVSVTGIASFVIPHFDFGLSLRLLRFPIMILAGTMGLIGIVISMILISMHLITLRSFGTPYLSPLTPFWPEDFKDVAIRAPWWAMDKRPSLYGKKNRKRADAILRPSLPGEEEGD
jgi:spore germination protein